MEIERTSDEIILTDDPYILGDLIQCCEKAYEIEESLYDSLVSGSARLLTCISILSVALITGIGISLEHGYFENSCHIALAASALFLAIALLLAVASQWRFRINAAAYPLIEKIVEPFRTQKINNRAESAYYYASSLSELHEAIAKRNKVLRILLTITDVAVVASILSYAVWIASIVVCQ